VCARAHLYRCRGYGRRAPVVRRWSRHRRAVGLGAIEHLENAQDAISLRDRRREYRLRHVADRLGDVGGEARVTTHVFNRERLARGCRVSREAVADAHANTDDPIGAFAAGGDPLQLVCRIVDAGEPARGRAERDTCCVRQRRQRRRCLGQLQGGGHGAGNHGGFPERSPARTHEITLMPVPLTNSRPGTRSIGSSCPVSRTHLNPRAQRVGRHMRSVSARTDRTADPSDDRKKATGRKGRRERRDHPERLACEPASDLRRRAGPWRSTPLSPTSHASDGRLDDRLVPVLQRSGARTLRSVRDGGKLGAG